MRSEDPALQEKWINIPSAVLELQDNQDEEQSYYQCTYLNI